MVTVLVGYGAHGRDIESIAMRARVPLVTADDGNYQGTSLRPVLLGVNDPRVRRDMADRYPNAAPVLVDPSVIEGFNTTVSSGCVIAPNAVLLRDVALCRHVHINYAATMTRCTIGAFTTIGPAATICGDVTIGEAVFIGAGAVICNLVTVGDGAVVGAGAIVTEDVPAGVTVVSPALRAVA